MSDNSSSNDDAAIGILFVAAIALSLFWLLIPEYGLNRFLAASYAFGDGVFVGWGDELATSILYQDDEYAKAEAMEIFARAAVVVPREYPNLSMIFLILGTFLSIFGMIAVWFAKNAKSRGDAFKLGAGAEIGEGVLYHTGYYNTVGEWVVSPLEIAATAVIAVLMGLIAMARVKK